MDKDIEQKNWEIRFPEIKIQSLESEHRLPEMNLLLSEKLIEQQKYSSLYAELTNKDFKHKLSEKLIEIERRNLSYADLLNLTAMLALEEEANDLEIHAKGIHLEAQDLIIKYLTICIEDQKQIISSVQELDELAKSYIDSAEAIEANIEKYQRKKKATKAADALHDLPGGNREKQEKIRSIWASGKFTSRSICAEQECTAIGMSYDSARKALRNTPEPV